MRWPGSTNSGTWMTAPVSSVAGFVPPPETESPRRPGSVSRDGQVDRARQLQVSRLAVDEQHVHLAARRDPAQRVRDGRSGTAICSKDSVSMKCASVPSAYRNCIFRDSVCTGRNFSPALNVRSITLPSAALRSLVRTNAPPLPGLTCWNSRILKIVPSTSMWFPFLN